MTTYTTIEAARAAAAIDNRITRIIEIDHETGGRCYICATTTMLMLEHAIKRSGSPIPGIVRLIADYSKAVAPEAVIEGLAELRKAMAAETAYLERYRAMMEDESNDGACPPAKPTGPSAQELAVRYPLAALYLRAESYSCADHDVKSTAGSRAMGIIISGGDPELAKSTLDNWLVGVNID